MKYLFCAIFGLVFTLSFATSSFAQIIKKESVSLDLAKKISAVAEAEAAKNNLDAVISIVDDSGNLVYLEKMDNAQLGSINIAIEKAKTSVLFKRPSKSYEEKITAGNNTILSLKEVLPFEGGIPLILNDKIVGAIGISGGTPQQDGSIAKAAVDFFQSLKF